MVQMLEPNKIHSLPVVVRYQIPASSSTFSTLFSSSQQVYVHPNAGHEDGEEEGWGSIYLKTVIQGVLMSSPELHPHYASQPDLSLYVLDPRETYLRKSRASNASSSSTFPPHLRSHGSFSASSPQSNPASPNLSATQQQEVWTGKGLVSWALNEPGSGKNLITGRLLKSTLFSSIVAQSSVTEGMGALEALIMTSAHQDEETWGIEINLGLKSGQGSWIQGNPLAVASAPITEQRRALAISMEPSSTRPSLSQHQQPQSSPAVSQFSPHQQPIVPAARPSQSRAQTAPVAIVSAPSSSQPRPLSPSRVVSVTPNTKARDLLPQPSVPVNGKRPSTRKKKCTNTTHTHAQPPSRVTPQPPARRGASNLASSVTRVDQSLQRSSPAPSSATVASRTTRNILPASSDAESSSSAFPDDVPATLFSNPATLTKEQAERLMESPAFLSRLSQLTGHLFPLPTGPPPPGAATASTTQSQSRKRRSRAEEDKAAGNKKAKVNGKSAAGDNTGEVKAVEAESAPALMCYNCGRTKSAVWRTKVMDDGQSVRVCNACGLYWNKMRAMRPHTLWEGIDEDVKQLKRDSMTQNQTEQQAPIASRIDAQSGPSKQTLAPGFSPGASSFKRTLTTVVEQDAKRIAAMKMNKPAVPSGLKSVITSSPVLRSSTHAAGPMTSPPRGPGGGSKGVRNTKWNTDSAMAQSSPGGWNDTANARAAPSDNFNPIPATAAPTVPQTTPKKLAPPMQTTPKRRSPRHMSQAEKNEHMMSVDESPNTAIRRILGTDAAIQSLQMPLSDDGEDDSAGRTRQLGGSMDNDYDWNTDISSFFDVEGFTTNQTSFQDHHRRLNAYGSGREDDLRSEATSANEDDVLSQLFNRTSSVMMESSPSSIPFDFSQLPPSSPPMSHPSDLPHSALLLSSPDLSPFDTTLSSGSLSKKVSPARSSGKASNTPGSLSAYTPAPTAASNMTTMSKSPMPHGQVANQNQGGADLKSLLGGMNIDQATLDDFVQKLLQESSKTEAVTPATTQQGVVMSDTDIFALFEKTFTQ